jgi:ribosome assembly protein 1
MKMIDRLKRRLERVKSNDSGIGTEKAIRDFDNNIEAGFQLATFQGPLCAEPVEGLAYFVEDIDVDQELLEREIGMFTVRLRFTVNLIDIEHNRTAQVTGSVITVVRDACRNGLLDWSPRLMLAMYSCDIQASSTFA